MLLAAGQFAEDNAQQWSSFFDIDQLNQQLHNSLDNLANLSNVAAKKGTFLIGGAAIQILIKDPLIPDQIQAPRMREALRQTMLEYDNYGRAIWVVQLKDSPSIITTSNVFAFNSDPRTP